MPEQSLLAPVAVFASVARKVAKTVPVPPGCRGNSSPKLLADGPPFPIESGNLHRYPVAPGRSPAVLLPIGLNPVQFAGRFWNGTNGAS